MKNKRHLSAVIATVLFSIVAMASCGRNSSNKAAPAVSFSKDIQPIFSASCAISTDCHVGSSNTNDHIDLTDSMAYATIVSKDLVSAGNAGASLLYNEVSTGIMPKAPYSRLPSAQVSLIYNWIQQGAKNN